jgi:hypothetical protein
MTPFLIIIIASKTFCLNYNLNQNLNEKLGKLGFDFFAGCGLKKVRKGLKWSEKVIKVWENTERSKIKLILQLNQGLI